MSDKDNKAYLIKRGWSYTGRFPHSWRDPQSDVSDTPHNLADAVAIQSGRDHVEIPPEPLIATRIVMETVTRADRLFAEAGADALSSERMAVDRVAQMLREQIELAGGRVRAGLLGTRNKTTAATTSPEIGGKNKRGWCEDCGSKNIVIVRTFATAEEFLDAYNKEAAAALRTQEEEGR